MCKNKKIELLQTGGEQRVVGMMAVGGLGGVGGCLNVTGSEVGMRQRMEGGGVEGGEGEAA